MRVSATFPGKGKVARAPGRRTRGKGKTMRGRVGCCMRGECRPEEWRKRVLKGDNSRDNHMTPKRLSREFETKRNTAQHRRFTVRRVLSQMWLSLYFPFECQEKRVCMGHGLLKVVISIDTGWGREKGRKTSTETKKKE
jgi:hypothetical protein